MFPDCGRGSSRPSGGGGFMDSAPGRKIQRSNAPRLEAEHEPYPTAQRPDCPADHLEHPFSTARPRRPDRICSHFGFVPALQNPRQPNFVDHKKARYEQCIRHARADRRVRHVEPSVDPYRANDGGQDRDELEPAQGPPLLSIVRRALEVPQAEGDAENPASGAQYGAAEQNGDFCDWTKAFGPDGSNRRGRRHGRRSHDKGRGHTRHERAARRGTDEVRAKAVNEFVSDPQARSRQPLSNRGPAQVQERRHVRHRLAFAVKERHHLARVLRQEVDGPGDRPAAFFGHQMLTGIRSRIGASAIYCCWIGPI
jgi:hypothetical protein